MLNIAQQKLKYKGDKVFKETDYKPQASCFSVFWDKLKAAATWKAGHISKKFQYAWENDQQVCKVQCPECLVGQNMANHHYGSLKRLAVKSKTSQAKSVLTLSCFSEPPSGFISCLSATFPFHSPPSPCAPAKDPLSFPVAVIISPLPLICIFCRILISSVILAA